jgi:hypothetical protein
MCPIVRAGFSCVAQTTTLEEVLTLIVRVFWNPPVQWLRGLARPLLRHHPPLRLTR